MKKKVSSALAVALLFSGLGTQAFAATQVDVDNAASTVVSAQNDLTDAKSAETEAKAALVVAQQEEAAALATFNAARAAEAIALKRYNAYVAAAKKAKGKLKTTYLAQAAEAKQALAEAKVITKEASTEYAAARANTRLARADVVAASNVVRISVKQVSDSKAALEAVYQAGEIQDLNITAATTDVDFVKVNGKVYTINVDTIAQLTNNGETTTSYGTNGLAGLLKKGDSVKLIVENGVVSSVVADLLEIEKARFTKALDKAIKVQTEAKQKLAAVSEYDKVALNNATIRSTTGVTTVDALETKLKDDQDLSKKIDAAKKVDISAFKRYDTAEGLQVKTTEIETAISTFDAVNPTTTASPYGDFKVAVKDLTEARKALNEGIAKAEALIASSNALLVANTADKEALNANTANASVYTNLQDKIKAGSTLNVKIKAAKDALTAESALSASDLVVGNSSKLVELTTEITSADSKKTTFTDEVARLKEKREALTKSINTFNTKLPAARETLSKVSYNDAMALGSAYSDYLNAVKSGGTFEQQLNAAATAYTSKKSADDLITIKGSLEAAVSGKTLTGTSVTAWDYYFAKEQSNLKDAREKLAAKIAEADATLKSEVSKYASNVASLNILQANQVSVTLFAFSGSTATTTAGNETISARYVSLYNGLVNAIKSAKEVPATASTDQITSNTFTVNAVSYTGYLKAITDALTNFNSGVEGVNKALEIIKG